MIWSTFETYIFAGSRRPISNVKMSNWVEFDFQSTCKHYAYLRRKKMWILLAFLPYCDLLKPKITNPCFGIMDNSRGVGRGGVGGGQNCKQLFMYMHNWDKGVAPFHK